MNQVFEQILKDYKKGNQETKSRMIAKFGFKTEKEFLNFLNNENTPDKVETPVPTDYVIAFDTTGSMASYIENVKKHVKSLIPNLFKDNPDLNLRIIAFGDYYDMSSATSFGNAFQDSGLTNIENDLIKFVTQAKNTSGGDGDEFYELVIKKITEETPWREGSNRTVLFIGDADPHKVGYSFGKIVQNAQIDWRKEAAKAAELKIQFDTLRIHNNSWYKELSTLTNGVCINFASANNTSEIAEAATAVRYNKSKFRTMSLAAEKSGDAELIGAYKSLNVKL